MAEVYGQAGMNRPCTQKLPEVYLVVRGVPVSFSQARLKE
jgi:hypothetical protein